MNVTMDKLELIQLCGTGGLVAALIVATRYQTRRLAETQREQIALLRGTVSQCTATMLAVKEALDGCRARQTGDTAHFKQPKP